MTFETAFAEIALTLVAATAVGALGLWLRQPLIVSFIAVGILVGPAGLGLVTRHEQIELLASVGIALLLFVVGLKLDVHTIRTLGPVALATGLGQIAFTSVIGLLIALALGMGWVASAYVAVALTFSSTIIIVKLLSDKREIDALHGRIAIGFLIVQDIAVIVAMIGITALAGVRPADQPLWLHAVVTTAKACGFLAIVIGLARGVLPNATMRLARSPELLVLFGIAWAVALAAAADYLGLSKEVGAFVAGASLASTPYRESMASRLVSLRDFLLLFFFIDLGARLDVSLLALAAWPALVLSAFVLMGNPLIVVVIMGLMGYRKRTSFLAGLTVAQISEFSLILTALGVSVGHIGRETLALVTSVGLITIGLSTYLIIYSALVYEWVAPWLSVFECARPRREAAVDLPGPARVDVVVFGLGRYGSGIVRHLLLRRRSVIGVDFDPEALARWRAEGLPVVYGDASDPDLFDHVPLEHADWIVSTAPDVETSRTLLHHLRQRGFTGRTAVACRSADDGDRVQVQGADLLLRPYADAAEQAADALTSSTTRLSALAHASLRVRELRLGSASRWAGQRIGDIPVRDQFGASILAVSRGGRTTFNPGASYQLFPGDRLIMAGESPGVDHAVDYLSLAESGTAPGEPDDFEIATVRVAALSGWAGNTLAVLEPSTRLGVSVLAMAGANGTWSAPDARRPLSPDDVLVLGGSTERLSKVLQPWGARPASPRGR
ncbi:MAG: cation:proton antiporter [Dehalococcoidia bacterium]